jgi:type I restriction enzyme R subunit
LTAPETAARANIDRMLIDAGWVVQDRDRVNLAAGRGIAVREFVLKAGHGTADYLLYVDRKAAGAMEAKPEGETLTGVEVQSEKYSKGLPETMPAHITPLPFLYQTTGVETRFTNCLDPEARSREVFAFHRPETLAGWLAEEPLWMPQADGRPHPLSQRAATLRARLRALPAVPEEGLWPVQLRAVQNLERSLALDHPRALIQMATGSGKTHVAVCSAYRLIKHGNARRVLFLVDRANLGRQALKEFQQFVTPDDRRKFSELYNIQHLQSNNVDPVARVCISTVQRLYSMLQGKAIPEDVDEAPLAMLDGLYREPPPVDYNPALPIEFFDVIFIDECHRSIYTLWRQVLEYFDAHLIGLTATPSKQTFGFFHQNLVMEYGHERAVADGVNVDFDVYRIRTQITQGGSKVEAGLVVDLRDRETRRKRWERLDEDLVYGPADLDRDVVSQDQIRTVMRTFRDRLFTDIFPGRTDVPKTLIYAKDDSHADDIVQIVRDEFGKGNQFAEKITYKSGTARIVNKVMGTGGVEREVVTYKSTGVTSDDLLSSFRNSYYPRIAVTVDLIATGTDVKPLEIVMFMRAVRSRNHFEQMKGRGVRVISDTDLQAVTPDAKAKSRFVIVDCVGVCEQELSDTHPLERKPTVSFEKLLQAVALGSTDPDVASSLAGRLARLDRQLGKAEREELSRVTGGVSLQSITAAMVSAIDPDTQAGAGSPAAAAQLIEAALSPIATNPDLRQRLLDLKKRYEQTIDTVSKDIVLEAAYSPEATERARGLVASFEAYIREHRDEITALQILYSRPYGHRLTFEDIKALADAIEAPPRAWTPELLWRAYETLDRSRVRGASPGRLLTNLVSLVRFATHQENDLVAYPDVVAQRFETWLASQERGGRRFSPEQRRWLENIRDHIAANLSIGMDDLDLVPFNQRGGLGRAHQLFGDEIGPLLEELTEVLAA